MSGASSFGRNGISFTKKAISVEITLGKGSFGQTGQNTVNISGKRIFATIQKSMFPYQDQGQVRIYGVRQDIMNTVSTLGIYPWQFRGGNNITVKAGDLGGQMPIVYTGMFFEAWQDFQEAPDTALVIRGLTGHFEAGSPTQPLSYPDSISVATVMQTIASNAGWVFENNGVNVTLGKCYFPGTAIEQAHAVARQAKINMYLDSATNPVTLAIFPQNETRKGTIPLVSVKTGMIGYPQYVDFRMRVRTLFNPAIRLMGQIELQSSIGNSSTTNSAPATSPPGGPNGIWQVTGPLIYELSSEAPGGPWHCDLTCNRTTGPKQ
jgi:hypothetical protein